MGRTEMTEKPNKVLDCVGLYCPIPVFNTKEAIDKMTIGEILEVIANDPASEEDIKRWAKRTGNEFHFVIKKVK